MKINVNLIMMIYDLMWYADKCWFDYDGLWYADLDILTFWMIYLKWLENEI